MCSNNLFSVLTIGKKISRNQGLYELRQYKCKLLRSEKCRVKTALGGGGYLKSILLNSRQE